MSKLFARVLIALGMAFNPIVCSVAQSAAVNYDIVYVRAPRFGDQGFTRWPEVFNPVKLDPGADLMLLKPDGREEVLFAGGNGGVVDPTVSLDGRSVYFSYFPDLRPLSLNSQREDAPKLGADIYRIDLVTRVVTRLTEQIWTPPTGAVKWSNDHLSASSTDAYFLGYGIYNLGAMPLPNGQIIFTSSRDGYMPNKTFSFPNMRLYRMDDQGRNIEALGHLNIGSALHPTVLRDGRVMFSSWENEANRDQRIWSLWTINPDGTNWQTLMSAFNEDKALHFQTQLSDGRVGVVEYYNLNNSGFGSLLAFEPSNLPSGALHGASDPNDVSNPAVRRGLWFFQPGHPTHLQPRFKQYRFSPRNLTALSAFTHSDDEASSRDLNGQYAGKVTHPSGAPGNNILLVYSPGPANHLSRPVFLPRVDGGIYLLRNGAAATSQNDLVLIKNSPLYNEMQPRAVVPYTQIYGQTEPDYLPELANDGQVDPALPAGTPFGIVGSSSLYKRDSKPGSSTPIEFGGWEAFNTSENDTNPNWFTQGADAGKYSNSDIHAIRIIAMEGVAHKSYGPMSNVVGFKQFGEKERYRILGEFPVRNRNAAGQPYIDPDGNPDTSFIAKIPADLSFTFQTLDQDGLVLNMAQTWHQLRPGEKRTNCGSCHGHSQAPTLFSQTAAGRGQTLLQDLTEQTPLLTRNPDGSPGVRVVNARVVNVEYHRDIKPILLRSCVSCHRAGNEQGNLRLDDDAIIGDVESTYKRLADDQAALYGYKPVISSLTWRQENASRYIRKFQSRRSLLMWKIMGRRLDGWTNSDHPTEVSPGVAASLPNGANPNRADLDYTGTAMPPPGSVVPALSADEKMLFARWIDLGAPINHSNSAEASLGWLHDEQKPTLTMAHPMRGINTDLRMIRVGCFDADTGINHASFSVRASLAINGRAPGTELADLFVSESNWVRALTLQNPPITQRAAWIDARIKDMQGNETQILRHFDLRAAQDIFANGFE
jgi:Hydrazine synthase alpha subunit middle domain